MLISSSMFAEAVFVLHITNINIAQTLIPLNNMGVRFEVYGFFLQIILALN